MTAMQFTILSLIVLMVLLEKRCNCDDVAIAGGVDVDVDACLSLLLLQPTLTAKKREPS